MNKFITGVTIALAVFFSGMAQAQPPNPTVVLVHGAFADGSSWNRVIPMLEAKGLHVVSVQEPLSSLKDDVAATRRVINQQNGPVVLVGHSWGGTVITQAGNNDKVKALVYVAAFAPDAGQNTNDLLQGMPAPPWANELRKDEDGYLTLSHKGISQDFASDLPETEQRLVAATQVPWFSGEADEKVTQAAWHDRPSWDVVTLDDRMIPPLLQQRMAKNIGAKVVPVSSSHVVMLSHPREVAHAIEQAAASVH